MKAVTAVLLTSLVSTTLASTHASSAHSRRHHKQGPVTHEQALAKRAVYSGMATWYDVGTGNAGYVSASYRQFFKSCSHTIQLTFVYLFAFSQQCLW